MSDHNPTPSASVRDAVIEALDEGVEILVNLTECIQKHGNYSPDSTVTFIDNALQCFRKAAVLSQAPADAAGAGVTRPQGNTP